MFAAANVICVLMVCIQWYPSVMIFCVVTWALVDQWIRGWMRSDTPEQMRWPIGFVKRSTLGALALFVALLIGYVHESLTGGPVAGLATRYGTPFEVR